MLGSRAVSARAAVGVSWSACSECVVPQRRVVTSRVRVVAILAVRFVLGARAAVSTWEPACVTLRFRGVVTPLMITRL